MASVAYSVQAQAFVVALDTTNLEYAFTLSKETKGFRIQMRDTTDLRLAFETGKVAGSTDPFHTIKGGNPAHFDKLYFNGNILYLAATGGSKKVEILVFT